MFYPATSFVLLSLPPSLDPCNLQPSTTDHILRLHSSEIMTGELPIPNVRHGQRIILSVIDELVQQEPNSTWVSVPIDEGDLSKGYKEITYGQFSNAVNHAVQWLRKTLPPSSEPSQSFAYAGPKDLRYPILAVAAGKLGKVVSSVVLPLFPYSAFYY